MNRWDDQRKVWVDDSTGNWYDPNVGVWNSPQGGTYNEQTGQWQNNTQTGTGAFQVGVGETDQARQENLTEDLSKSTANNANSLSIAQLQALTSRYGVDQTTATSRLAEARQEREDQASMAANPSDFVKYELYKRMLGGAAVPQPAYATASQFANGGAGGPQSGLNGQQFGGQPASGGYPAAPPAYSDQTLQGVLASLYGGSGGTLYNPNVAGTGQFGAQILSPGAISRSTALNLSDSEKSIMNSFLQGGSTGTGGASIDPTDYWQQQQRSMVPTLSDSSYGSGTNTNYS